MKGQLLDAIPLTTLHGVGAGQAGKLAGIGLHTLQDLLFHLPLRYEDQTRLYTITDLLPGIYATVSGEMLRTDVVFGRKRMMTCQISDGTGILTLRFFNFSATMKNALVAGKQVTAYGEIRRGKNGPEIFHPEYKVRQSDTSVELQETLTLHSPLSTRPPKVSARPHSANCSIRRWSCSIPAPLMNYCRRN